MAIVEIIFNRTKGNHDEVLTITKNGLAFSASFIKNQKLEQKQAVKFYKDSENEYWLGFEFFDDKATTNSLALQSSATDGKSTFTRTLKATALFSSSIILQAIRENPNKLSKVFEIKKDKVNGKFFISLRPVFEKSIRFEERSSINSEIQGIYRYLNEKGEIIYIGKGFIKDRANSPERIKWQIKKIQYSELFTEEDCFKWESYYIDEYESEHGMIPVFNEIKGRNSK